MSNIKIVFKIENRSNDYFYEGKGTKNKDIISFKDLESEYYVDLKVRRITKIANKELAVIDFKKSCIELDINGFKTKLDMKVIEYKEKKDSLFVKYIIEEEITILLEWSKYE